MKNYVGCMVMNAAGIVGTVLAVNKFDNTYYNICWYRPDRVDVTTGIHYTHVSGWVRNIELKLKSQ